MTDTTRNGMRSPQTAKAVEDAIAAIRAADGELNQRGWGQIL
jgi:hypothetical protein